ncbi:hypothetical protein GCM10018779_15630 [Streptomyces griseocarneus]|nr:hypothetical protein GCM10018779_15630 [Streptomyces griseocarneus]
MRACPLTRATAAGFFAPAASRAVSEAEAEVDTAARAANVVAVATAAATVLRRVVEKTPVMSGSWCSGCSVTGSNLVRGPGPGPSADQQRCAVNGPVRSADRQRREPDARS